MNYPVPISLHTLGKCISALVKKSKGGNNSGIHVPYRESKLTRLLQDSLGGNSKTFLIAAVSPSSNCVDESINTLKFADRAKQVMIQAKVNESRPIDHEMVKNLQNEVKNLKVLLREVSMYVHPTPVSEREPTNDEMEEGGTFLTNHASVSNGRSGRLAFQENVENSKDDVNCKKAELFGAIKLALGGGSVGASLPILGLNISSYSAPPAVIATDSAQIKSSVDSGAANVKLKKEVNRLNDLLYSKGRQVEALEQKELHTWHLLEAIQV